MVHNISLPTSSHALRGFTQANQQRSGLDNATTYGFLMPTYLRPSQILGRSLVNHGPLKFVYDYDYGIPSQFCAGIIMMIIKYLFIRYKITVQLIIVLEFKKASY